MQVRHHDRCQSRVSIGEISFTSRGDADIGVSECHHDDAPADHVCCRVARRASDEGDDGPVDQAYSHVRGHDGLQFGREYCRAYLLTAHVDHHGDHAIDYRLP